MKFIVSASVTALVLTASASSIKLNEKKPLSLISEIRDSVKMKTAEAWPSDVWPEDCHEGRITWIDSDHYVENVTCVSNDGRIVRSYSRDVHQLTIEVWNRYFRQKYGIDYDLLCW